MRLAVDIAVGQGSKLVTGLEDESSVIARWLLQVEAATRATAVAAASMRGLGCATRRRDDTVTSCFLVGAS